MKMVYWYPYCPKIREIRKNMSKEEKRRELIPAFIVGGWIGSVFGLLMKQFIIISKTSNSVSDRLLLIITILVAYAVVTPFLVKFLFRFYNSTNWAKKK